MVKTHRPITDGSRTIGSSQRRDKLYSKQPAETFNFNVGTLSGTWKVPQLDGFNAAHLKQKAEIQASATQNDGNDDEEDEGALVGDGMGFTFDDEMTAPRSPERENPTGEAFEIKADQAGPALESAETDTRVQDAKAVAGRSPATPSMKVSC